MNSGKDYKHLNKGSIPVYGTGGYMLSVDKELSNKDAIGIGRKGTIDHPQYLKAPFWTVDTLFFMTPKKGININFAFALSQTINWKKYDESTGLPSLSKNSINNISVKIPKYNEQKKIGNLISQIERLLALQQRKNQDIINVKKSILDKIFCNDNIKKWRKLKLNNILSIPIDEPKEVTNVSDIISVKLNVQGISKTSNRSTLKLGSTKYYIRHAGQFIFGKQNFFNGSMAIIPSDCEGKVSSKDVPSLNINTDIVVPYFLWLYLSRPNFYKNTERWATGTGSKRLHIKDLLSLNIYIPDTKEQLRISKLIKYLDTQILSNQRHLEELKNIKKYLLQNMLI